MSFSLPSYRSLYKYLGEMNALVELTELASRDFQMRAIESKNIEGFIETASSKHEVKVNASEFDGFSAHLAHLYIITVYQSVEYFLGEFKKEHIELHGKEWGAKYIELNKAGKIKREQLDALTYTIKNISYSESYAEKYIGKDLISRFQYYRLIRNWFMHSTDTDKLIRKHKKLIPYSSENEEEFKNSPGPNLPDKLSYDDFILFSRITKAIGKKLCELSIPSNDRWSSIVSVDQFKSVKNNQKRLRNAVTGYLCTKYGMDEGNAEKVKDFLLTH